MKAMKFKRRRMKNPSRKTFMEAELPTKPSPPDSLEPLIIGTGTPSRPLSPRRLAVGISPRIVAPM